MMQPDLLELFDSFDWVKQSQSSYIDLAIMFMKTQFIFLHTTLTLFPSTLD